MGERGRFRWAVGVAVVAQAEEAVLAAAAAGAGRAASSSDEEEHRSMASLILSILLKQRLDQYQIYWTGQLAWNGPPAGNPVSSRSHGTNKKMTTSFVAAVHQPPPK